MTGPDQVHCFVYLFITLLMLLNITFWNDLYRIWPNYRTYPYKGTLKYFRSLQITASVLFVHFFIKADVVGTHLNCINLSMQ